MQSLNIWRLFHTYYGLANSGKAARLTCPNDASPLVTRMRWSEDTDNLYLWCPNCDTWTHPGLDIIRQVEAVVKEHYDVRVDLG